MKKHILSIITISLAIAFLAPSLSAQSVYSVPQHLEKEIKRKEKAAKGEPRQGREELAAKKRKEKEERRLKRIQQKKDQKRANLMFKEANRLYHAKRNLLAKGKLVDLKEFLSTTDIGERFLIKMDKKMNKLLERVRKAEAKRQERLKKLKEKDQARIRKERERQRRDKGKTLSQKRNERNETDRQRMRRLKKVAAKKERALEDRVKERRAKLKAERVKLNKEIRKGVDDLYSKAVSLYQKKEYEQAKSGFLEVNELHPNYKSTNKYLIRIDDDIATQKVKHTQQIQKNRGLSRDELISATLDAISLSY